MLRKILTAFCAGMLVLLTALGASAASLKYGSEGLEVTRLQMNLNGLGYGKLTVDGVYGKATESAVYVFQSANNLAVDGIMGDRSLAEIKTIVTDLQKKLNSLGYSVGAADGVYGSATTAAVKRYQSANGLTADGLAGYRTLAKLSLGSTSGSGGSYASTASKVRTYSLSRDKNKTIYGIKVSDFACHDGSDTIMIDDKLAALLQDIQTHFGRKVKITSGYRNKSYNSKIGRASNSYHTKGMAADISIDGVSQRTLARYAESLGVKGIGVYQDFVHVDTRTSKYFWSYGSQVSTFK